VATGCIVDPFADALDAAGSDPRTTGVRSLVRQLAPPQRRRLVRELVRHAGFLSADWGAIPWAWLPRTADRISVPLAGGRAVLAGTIDLVLGSPPSDRRSVCLVRLCVGSPGPGDRKALHHLALLETLRTGAAPLRIANYYSATGRLDAEEATDALLARAVGLTIVSLTGPGASVTAVPGSPPR
jgi:hypothetical protein